MARLPEEVERHLRAAHGAIEREDVGGTLVELAALADALAGDARICADPAVRSHLERATAARSDGAARAGGPTLSDAGVALRLSARAVALARRVLAAEG